MLWVVFVLMVFFLGFFVFMLWNVFIFKCFYYVIIILIIIIVFFSYFVMVFGYVMSFSCILVKDYYKYVFDVGYIECC